MKQTSRLSPDLRPTDAEFAAIKGNDAAADGRFLYGVSTTKIFCRPSCVSRAPKRENVRIFADAEAAQSAGFRPCKRCRPDQMPAADARLERARKLIDERLAAGEATPTLTQLARVAHMGATHLQRRFAAAYGLSPRAYAEAQRVAALKHELRQGNGVSDAIYGAGFGAASRVYEKAGRWLGMTPAAYRRGGEGLTLTVAIRHTAMGPTLVAESPRGIAALLFGSQEKTMLAELRDEFPAARIDRDDKAGAAAFEALAAMLAGRPAPKGLRLDLRGTPFQIRVWTALQAIPAGETRSYREIAASLGHPKASRAVGSACANNIIGVLVPCHRALRSDGGLGGYRWGLERKEKLLTGEGVELEPAE
ncbi:bifunctional DNA-binding transcriptional regulator/O6-methylguanine-DNA methyltransferase Ada [Ferrovibrio sp.]|uniref:bifunctional DNA-binding transcriptional regulator/O6-methylguanine-DNA methyltransferase Ada n=1 Tax=Ferrovibrio sp. TaxID=1917215 RepID=UPI002633470B|nr:bifunctional DNA-binding transcriptional regulator/O6-methylguanine-DNA methyltransferase Ada [Ferrovibrio sp.]